jgi:tetratricopeptide (TPR) repeat protein
MTSRLAAAEAQLDAFRSAGKWEDVSRLQKQLEKSFDTTVTNPSHPTQQHVLAYRACVAGEVAAHKKRYDEAKKHYCKALQAVPQYPDALILLATLNLETGAWPPAGDILGSPSSGKTHRGGTTLMASLNLRDLKLSMPSLWPKRERDQGDLPSDTAGATSISTAHSGMLSPPSALPFSDSDVIVLLSRAKAAATVGLDGISQYRALLRLQGLYLLCQLHERGYPPPLVSVDQATPVGEDASLPASRSALAALAAADDSRKNGYAAVLHPTPYKVTADALCLLAAASCADATWKMLAELVDKRFGGTGDVGETEGAGTIYADAKIRTADTVDAKWPMEAADCASLLLQSLTTAPPAPELLLYPLRVAQIYYDSCLSAYAVNDHVSGCLRMSVSSRFLSSPDATAVSLDFAYDQSAAADASRSAKSATLPDGAAHAIGYGPRHMLRVDVKCREVAAACLCRLPLLLHRLGDMRNAIKAYRACLEWNGPVSQACGGTAKDALIEGLIAALAEGASMSHGVNDVISSAQHDDQAASEIHVPPWLFAHRTLTSMMLPQSHLMSGEAEAPRIAREILQGFADAGFGAGFTGPVFQCVAAIWRFKNGIATTLPAQVSNAPSCGTYSSFSAFTNACVASACCKLIAASRPRIRSAWASLALALGTQALLTGPHGFSQHTFLGTDDIPVFEVREADQAKTLRISSATLPAPCFVWATSNQGNMVQLLSSFFSALNEVLSVGSESHHGTDEIRLSQGPAEHTAVDAAASDAPIGTDGASTLVAPFVPVSLADDAATAVPLVDHLTSGPYVPDSVLLLMACRVALWRQNSPSLAVSYAAQAVVACGRHLHRIARHFPPQVMYGGVLTPASSDQAHTIFAAWRRMHIAACYEGLAIALLASSRAVSHRYVDVSVGAGAVSSFCGMSTAATRPARRAIASLLRAVRVLVTTGDSTRGTSESGQIAEVSTSANSTPVAGKRRESAAAARVLEGIDEDAMEDSATSEQELAAHRQLKHSVLGSLEHPAVAYGLSNDQLEVVSSLQLLEYKHWTLVYHIALAHLSIGAFDCAKTFASHALRLSDAQYKACGDVCGSSRQHYALPFALAALCAAEPGVRQFTASVIHAGLVAFPQSCLLRILEARCTELLNFSDDICDRDDAVPSELITTAEQISLQQLLDLYTQCAANADACAWAFVSSSAMSGSVFALQAHPQAYRMDSAQFSVEVVPRGDSGLSDVSSMAAPPVTGAVETAVYAHLQVVRIACQLGDVRAATAALLSADNLVNSLGANLRIRFGEVTTSDTQTAPGDRVWSSDAGTPTAALTGLPATPACFPPDSAAPPALCRTDPRIRADLLFAAGCIHETAGNISEAEAQYATALSLYPEHVPSHGRLAELIVCACSTAENKLPRASTVTSLLDFTQDAAVVLLMKAKLDSAVAHCEAALRCDPTSSIVWSALAKAKAALGEYRPSAAASLNAIKYGSRPLLAPVWLLPIVGIAWE